MKKKYRKKQKTDLLVCLRCNKKHYIENREMIMGKEGENFIAKSVCPYCKKEGYTYF